MADAKISALPAGTALLGTEVAPFVQGGATVKITATQIKDWADSVTIGTTPITSGTATRLLYETAGNVLGEISGATSNGTTLTLTAPVLGVASATSLALTGTAGAGFEEYPSQSSNPAAPASGFREFADATGRKSWIRQSDGFVRTWDATLTASRVWTIPDATGDIALRGQAAQAFTTFV
jgi:hypothetical protein